MNYEQKYKEAMRTLNSYTKDEYGCTRVRPENIFPELKESEDERIRKELIHCIKNLQKGVSTWNSDSVFYVDALAWLEKLGKKEELDEASYRTGIKRVLDNPESYGLEKQGRQKTTAGKSYIEIFPKFSVGDTLCRQGWSNHTVRKVYVDNITATYVCENEEGLESHIDISEQDEWNKIEQNPAWNEEDDAVDIAIKIIQNGGDDCAGILDSDKALKWLKSLKYRVQPQPKQEWSEEDEEMLSELIDVLNGGMTITPTKTYIDWLKSIKPNHWKPSEQNIKDLEWCADLVKDKMGVGFHRLQVFVDELKSL